MGQILRDYYTTTTVSSNGVTHDFDVYNTVLSDVTDLPFGALTVYPYYSLPDLFSSTHNVYPRHLMGGAMSLSGVEQITSIADPGLYGNIFLGHDLTFTNLSSAKGAMCFTYLGGYSYAGGEPHKLTLHFPALQAFDGAQFLYASKIIFDVCSYISPNALVSNNSVLEEVYLLSTIMVSKSNNTKVFPDGITVYVPSELLSSYQNDTKWASESVNWSNYLGY